MLPSRIVVNHRGGDRIQTLTLRAKEQPASQANGAVYLEAPETPWLFSASVTVCLFYPFEMQNTSQPFVKQWNQCRCLHGYLGSTSLWTRPQHQPTVHKSTRGSSELLACLTFSHFSSRLLFQQVYFTLLCHYCFQKWYRNVWTAERCISLFLL